MEDVPKGGLTEEWRGSESKTGPGGVFILQQPITTGEKLEIIKTCLIIFKLLCKLENKLGDLDFFHYPLHKKNNWKS